jgi:hypothetical protein
MSSSEYPVTGLPAPDPSYGPEQVVELQLEALADNDNPVKNAGVKTAFNFASPANRRATGPLARFIKMVEGPRYAPMIDHIEATTDALDRTGDRAEQRVTLTGLDGRTATYRFGLSMCEESPVKQCWLTDNVLG